MALNLNLFFGTLLVFVMNVSFAANSEFVGTSYDNYSKATGISTKNYDIPDVGGFFDPGFAYAHLAGQVTDNGREGLWLDIYFSTTSWKFYDRAQDSDGNELPVVISDRRVEGPNMLVEHFLITLTRDYLERHASSGFDIRILGKYGRMIVKLPPEYVVQFISALSTVEANVRSKLASSVSPGVNRETKPTGSPFSSKPKLGINYVAVTDAFLNALHLKNMQGVVVVQVASDSVAARSGLLPGDIISEIGPIKLKSELNSIPDALASAQVGQAIRFVIWRDAKRMEVDVNF